MPPARPDIIVAVDDKVPFRERRACSGCRAIKSRCMMRQGGGACSRCARLQLECNFLEHRRGIKQTAKHARDSMDSKGVSSPPTPRKSRSDSPSRPVYETPSQSFSIKSMLAVDGVTIASSSALLASTTFATMQGDEDGQTVTNGHGKALVVSRPESLVENIVSAGVLHEHDVHELISFYYAKLNPIIALLDPLLYTEDALNRRENSMLLASICTVSAKFCIPHAYARCLSFLEKPLAKIASQDVAPQLEYVLSLSILAMWKHPQDGSSWRKLRLAITMALELGLHRAFNEVFASSARPRKKAISRKLVQRQRTFLQLACFEDGYQDQRRIPVTIDRSLLPQPWQWLEWLGDDVQDIDVRLAASRENALVKQDLLHQLKRDGNGHSGTSKSIALRRVQLIEMAIAAERANTRVWEQPEIYGLGKGRTHSGRPCLLFHTANTMFNYHRALFAVYSSPALLHVDPGRKQSVFLECCGLSIKLFELIAGPYGQRDYLRFVHDIVIMNLAVAAVWISDNWCQMPAHLASQAAAAVSTAAEVTAPCLDLHAEQASYLARFLAFCAKRIALLQGSVASPHGEWGGRDGMNAFAVTPMPANAYAVQHPPTAVVSSMTSVSPESLSTTDTSGTSDPSLQYLQDLLSVPCFNFDDHEGHNIMSFFQDDQHPSS